MSEASLAPSGELVIRTIAMPADANGNGDIFGGWLISQMDLGGAILARNTARSRVTTETLYLFARYVFETLGYRRFEWKCNDLNGPSKRAAERFGFAFEGVFRQHMVAKGQNRDTAWFAMIDGDWPRLKAGYEAWLDPANFDAEGRQRTKLQFAAP